MRTYMASCVARNQLRQKTIAALMASGWPEEPVVCLEDRWWEMPLERHMALVRTILEIAALADGEDDLIVLLEDDILFNRHFPHNVACWQPIRTHQPGHHFFASLFNPGVVFVTMDVSRACAAAKPETVYGAQALILSKETARFFVTCWGVCPATHADIKLARLAAMVCPILFHVPSLVQHVGIESLWGGPFLSATDFDDQWLAPASTL